MTKSRLLYPRWLQHWCCSCPWPSSRGLADDWVRNRISGPSGLPPLLPQYHDRTLAYLVSTGVIKQICQYMKNKGWDEAETIISCCGSTQRRVLEKATWTARSWLRSESKMARGGGWFAVKATSWGAASRLEPGVGFMGGGLMWLFCWHFVHWVTDVQTDGWC